MDELISRLRSLGEPRAPCTPERLHTLSRELGTELDPFLLAVYADHDGFTEAGNDAPFRLMPVDEVAQTHRSFQGMGEDAGFPTLAWSAFWTDDNSNYVACYTDGPLRGKLFLLDHDGIELAPRFRSARSFCTALVRAVDEKRDVRDVPTDYPAITAPLLGDDETDRTLALRYLAACGDTYDEDERTYLAHCAINLLPYTETAPLLAFAGDENDSIRDLAAGLLKRRRVESTLPRLVELLRTGPHGRKSAGREELARLIDEALSSIGTRFYRDLRDQGVELRRVRDGFEYRSAPEGPWRKL
jgi:hypothetical protein